MSLQHAAHWPAAVNPGNYKTGRFNFQLLNTRQHDHAAAERHVRYRKSYTVSDYIEHALSITSFEDFYLFATKLKNDCGFSMSGGGMSHKSAHEQPTAHFFYSSACGGWPAYYRNHLITDDPMVYYCHHNVLPLVWETGKDIKTIHRLNSHMADAMIDFGVQAFVTVPTHGANTSLSGFRYAVMRHDVLTRADIDNQLPLLSLLSTFMHEALSKLLQLDKTVDVVRLTPREKEVLRRVSCGSSTWEISESLHISENTVLTHMKNIHTKLGVKTRQHAVAKALSLNLI